MESGDDSALTLPIESSWSCQQLPIQQEPLSSLPLLRVMRFHEAESRQHSISMKPMSKHPIPSHPKPPSQNFKTRPHLPSLHPLHSSLKPPRPDLPSALTIPWYYKTHQWGQPGPLVKVSSRASILFPEAPPSFSPRKIHLCSWALLARIGGKK